MRKRWTQKLKQIFCATFRHSNLVSCCAQFVICSRCNEVLGDAFDVKTYDNNRMAMVNCDCERCRSNYRGMIISRFFSPKPEWLGYPVAGSYNAEQRRMEIDDSLRIKREKFPARRASDRMCA